MNAVKIGWGEKTITPFEGKIIIAGGVPFRAVDKLHDDLKATAMAVMLGGVRTIWLSCDFCHPTKQVEDLIISKLSALIPNFREEELILSGTHSTGCFYISDNEILSSEHLLEECESLMPIDKTREQFCNSAVCAVMEALENLEDAEICYNSIDILTGFCRRTVYKDGTAVMYGNVHREDFLRMEYPDSSDTKALYFYKKGTRILKGILAAVPCPAQADEASSHITADYWGYAREHIREHYNSDVKVLGLCRAAGELSPHRLFAKNMSEEWSVGAAERLGLWIAENIISHEKNSVPVEYNDYRAVTKEISFPVREIAENDYLWAKSYTDNKDNYDENGKDIRWDTESNARHIVKFYENKITHYNAKISVIKLGEIVFFTAPAELFTEYAKRIVAKFPENTVFDIQLTHDSIGYLPTKEAIEHGGYSTLHFSTFTDHNGGEFYINEIVKTINTII